MPCVKEFGSVAKKTLLKRVVACRKDKHFNHPPSVESFNMITKNLGQFFLGLALCTFLTSAAVAGPFDGWYDEDTSFSQSPAGQVFHQTLFTEYQKLSKDRNSSWGDGTDAELFNQKALFASTRTAVQEDFASDRLLSVDDQRVFMAAQDRLHTVFDKGGREHAPVESAVAQVSYDCWIEATERKAGNDAKNCKDKFERAIAAAEAKSPYELGQVKLPEAPAPQPAPIVHSKPFKDYYRVPFVFDKTQMTSEGEQIIAEAIRDAQAHPDLKIALRAHADRSGSDNYNLKLSKRRAEAVLNRMAATGVEQNRLRIVEAVGEKRSLIPTADGVKEQGNRIVEIDLRQ